MWDVLCRIVVLPFAEVDNTLYSPGLQRYSGNLHRSLWFLCYSSGQPSEYRSETVAESSSLQRHRTITCWWQIFMISSIIFHTAISNSFKAHEGSTTTMVRRNCWKLIKMMFTFWRLTRTRWRTVNQHRGNCRRVFRKHLRWIVSSLETWTLLGLMDRHWRISISVRVRTNRSVERGSISLLIGLSKLENQKASRAEGEKQSRATMSLPFNDDSTENSNDGCVMPWSFGQVIINELNGKTSLKVYRSRKKIQHDERSSSLLDRAVREVHYHPSKSSILISVLEISGGNQNVYS